MENNPRENLSEIDISNLNGSLFFDKENAAAGEKFIVFFLDDELFAVSAQKVSEVVHPPAITPLPNSPEWLTGIANLRGEIISVVDLAKLWRKKIFGTALKPKLIVLRGQNSNSSIAFTADRLSEIITLSEDKIHFCEEDASHIFGKAFHKSNVLNFIDTDKLALSLTLPA
jgi:purine-binding chemotaxis protein CheW